MQVLRGSGFQRNALILRVRHRVCLTAAPSLTFGQRVASSRRHVVAGGDCSHALSVAIQDAPKYKQQQILQDGTMFLTISTDVFIIFQWAGLHKCHLSKDGAVLSAHHILYLAQGSGLGRALESVRNQNRSPVATRSEKPPEGCTSNLDCSGKVFPTQKLRMDPLSGEISRAT
eukprot:5972531-Amphidinium_carterae.1